MPPSARPRHDVLPVFRPTTPARHRLHRPSRLPTVLATTATRRFMDRMRWLLAGL